MTEEEAKKKTCPIMTQSRGIFNCIASGCMMWRWHTKAKHDGSKFDTYLQVPTDSGYCGLAGRPVHD